MYLVSVSGTVAYLDRSKLKQLLTELRCEVEGLEEGVEITGRPLIGKSTQVGLVPGRISPRY